MAKITVTTDKKKELKDTQVRISKQVKEIAKIKADRENRSVSNYVEQLIVTAE